MSKYSKERVASVLAAARANVERLSTLEAVQEAAFEPTEPLETYRAEAHAFSERRVRAYTDRKINELRVTLEAQLGDEVGAAREFVLTVVGEALGQWREMLIADMTATYADTHAKLHDEIEKLRAQISKLSGKELGPIDLPNPIAARRLQ